MLNIAETMSRAGVGPEVLPVCETVQEALGNAHARLQKHGKLGMSGPEIQAMRELHAYHDLQRSSVTLGEYERAIQRTANRIHGANPGVKVFIDNPKEIRQELPYLSPSLTTREKV